MLRKRYVEYPGGIYHVISRGERREAIFLDAVDRHEFIKRLAEAVEGKRGEYHSGELRREMAGAKADRIVVEELSRQGWRESGLATRCQSDPGKLRIAARLRKETTLTIKAIASRVHLGSARSAQVRLHEWIKSSEATRQVE
jgi:hypothetical protein